MVLERKVWSNAFITINPNKSFNGTEDDFESYKKTFADVITRVFSLKGIEQIWRVQEGAPGPFEAIMVSTSVDAVLEIGERDSKLHAHVLVKVSHRSKLSIDNKIMRSYLCKYLEVDKIHLDVKIDRSASRSIEDYIHKHDV